MLTTQEFNNLLEAEKEAKINTFPNVIEELELNVCILESLQHREHLRLKEIEKDEDYKILIEHDKNFLNFAEMGKNKISAKIKSQKEMIKKLKDELIK